MPEFIDFRNVIRKKPAEWLLCSFLFILPFHSHAQYEHKLFTSSLLIEFKGYYGFLYAQHLELERFNAHFPAFELSLEQQTYGKHPWEIAYNYPIIGLSFFYSGLGYNPSLGQAFALMPYVNFPLYKDRIFTFSFRFALGAGYLTKKFDRLTNYKDIAIGSHINAAINLMFEGRFRLGEYLTLTTAICFQHFSNGSLKTPNYGVNAPMVSAGIAYRPVMENKDLVNRFIAPTKPFSAIIKHTIEFEIGFAVGYKNMQSEYGHNYFVYHAFENTFFQVSRKSKVGFGFDASYDESHKKILEMANVQVTNDLQIIKPGINAAYELMLSRLCFIANFGLYLGGKEKSNGPFYEKFCFQYQFSNDFFAQVLLKVHWGRADYIGWGLGYHFSVKYGKKTIK